jgi:hypothetical protein
MGSALGHRADKEKQLGLYPPIRARATLIGPLKRDETGVAADAGMAFAADIQRVRHMGDVVVEIGLTRRRREKNKS